MTVPALAPGTRLRSAVCSTEVAVVKPPSEPLELRCGGQPMVGLDAPASTATPAADGEGTLLGKRYEDPDTGLEVLCTKAGPSALSLGDRALVLKGTKPLPASD